MNHLRPAILTLAASAALAGPAAGGAHEAGATPIATTSTAFLTTAEARQATRREVLRVARRRGDEAVEDFEIKWCRRRSAVHVGCRYTMEVPIGWRGMSCHGGVRVIEHAGNRHRAHAWRECSDGAD